VAEAFIIMSREDEVIVMGTRTILIFEAGFVNMCVGLWLGYFTYQRSLECRKHFGREAEIK
jgi:hypothetical protein